MHDPILKKLLRLMWSTLLSVHALLSMFLILRPTRVKVFYGGARSGDVGGPLVKVKRLRKLFPENIWRYNIVYVLSNTPYLPGFALWLLRLRGVPMVHNQNGVFYRGWYEGDWEAQNQRMARTFHQADYVFYQSEFCKDAALIFLGERKGAGEVLYNAVDTTVFTPPESPTDRSERRYRFLLTGKIDAHLFYRIECSLQGLSEALQLGLDTEMVIAGWLAPEVEQWTAKLCADLAIEDRVTISGLYTQEQAPDIYRQADAYIMMKHNDPCPNTVLEALAVGLPVVYSDTGGVGELVGDAGVGLACALSWDGPQTPDVRAIGQAMLDIAKSHDQYSAKARERAVSLFDIRYWERRHAEIFAQLVQAKRA